MKWIVFILPATLITLLLGLFLYHVLKPPPTKIFENTSSDVKFVDISFNHSERNQLENQIKALIKQPQICHSASDCIKTYYGCPFGCSNLVNLNNHNVISALLRARESTSGYTCQYRCGPPKKLIPACVENICDYVPLIDDATDIRKFIESNTD